MCNKVRQSTHFQAIELPKYLLKMSDYSLLTGFLGWIKSLVPYTYLGPCQIYGMKINCEK